MTPMLRRRISAFALILGIAWTFAAYALEKESPGEYASRRTRSAELIKGGAMVLFGSPDPDLAQFKQENNFYYLTGFDEPDAILLIDASTTPPEETLFVPPRNAAQERWTGAKLAPGSDGERQTGIKSVRVLTDIPSRIARTLERTKTVYTLRGDRDSVEKLRKLAPAADVQDAAPLIGSLRIRKSPSELALLQKTAQITLAGHEAAARTIRPNAWEYQVQAAIEFEFRSRAAERPSFPSIVGSGPNSTTLHYNANVRQMKAGELVVVDIGSEYGGYAGDVTRTYPVGGKFSPRQREIYQIVLDAQKAALAKVRPGATISEIHQAAFNVIRSKGFSDREFPHGTSHHVGLEVHDVGSRERAMEPGMVITVEPGIYLSGEQLGVRIEDMVEVTATGYRLMSDFPKEIADIEALMSR